MNHILFKTGMLFCFSFILLTESAFSNQNDGAEFQNTNDHWRAGVAKAVITPDRPTWMSGYSGRERPSEGKIHDIWAKVLAIEDAAGSRAILITADIRNFPRNMTDRIKEKLEQQYGLARGEVILNSSHTHTGPLMYSDINYPYYLSKLDHEQYEVVRAYSEWFIDRVVELTGEVLESMEPAQVYAKNGVTRFAVNRRNNDSDTIERAIELAGPVDHSVPVLKIERNNGELLAVAFGYACHPTVLSDYLISGDYPGFAQLALEKEYPGATALFFQGAAGDQNPLPRRSVELAEQYGQSLAAAVSRVLKEDMQPLESGISTSYSEVDLPLETPPTRVELEQMADSYTGNRQEWALWLLEKLDRGESLITSYPYPIQVWKLGEIPVFSLAGELVVDYSIELKRIFGHDSIVMGYSNDVMSYIPTARIIREGGYEGDSSQWVRGMPSHWRPEIEVLIMKEVLRIAEKAGVTPM